LSDEKEREVRRMVLQAVEMEKRMRAMEKMLSEHRAGMGQREGKAEEAKEKEEEGRIEGEVHEYREQIRQLHGELTAHGTKRETLKSTPMGRKLLRTLDHKTNPRTAIPHHPPPPPAPVKRPPVPKQRRSINTQSNNVKPPAQRYGAPLPKRKPATTKATTAATKPVKQLSATRGGNSRFPNVAAIKADLKRSKDRADAVNAAMSPRKPKHSTAAVSMPRPLQPAQLDRYPTHIPTLKAQAGTVGVGKGGGMAGTDAKMIGNGPSEAAPALAAVMASIEKEAEEHRQMLQVRRESQLSAQAESRIGKGWKSEELKEQLTEVDEEEKTAVKSTRRSSAIAPVKSARDDFGVDDEVADDAIAGDEEYGDDDFD